MKHNKDIVSKQYFMRDNRQSSLLREIRRLQYQAGEKMKKWWKWWEDEMIFNLNSKQDYRDQVDEQDLARIVRKYPEKSMLYLTGEQMAGELRQRGYDVESPLAWCIKAKQWEVNRLDEFPHKR